MWRALVLSLAALVLAFLVMWVGLNGGLSRPLSKMFGPETSDQLLTRAMADAVQVYPRRLDDRRYAGIAEAARHEPLAAEPYFLFALDALNYGQNRRAMALLEEARRRSPRLRVARIFLVDSYLRANDVVAATSEMRALSRLVPDADALLSNTLTQLALDPATRAATRRALRGDPLIDQVLAQLVRQGAPPALILNFAAGLDLRKPAEWQALLWTKMVKARQAVAARALWSRFAGVHAGPVYDGRFQGMPGTLPFNWQLMSNEVGNSEMRPGPKLEVEYFGRATGDLAQQLLVLSPGRYRLSYVADGDKIGPKSQMSWQLSCDGSNIAIMSTRLDRVGPNRTRFLSDFVVPAGCEAQWLRLHGEAAEFPIRQYVEIYEIAVDGGGHS